MAMLIEMAKHKGIRFRYHAFGADIVAVSRPRLGSVEWFEVRRRQVKPGVLSEYLVRLHGRDLGRAMGELVISGAQEDDRDPIVQKSLQDFADGCRAALESDRARRFRS